MKPSYLGLAASLLLLLSGCQKASTEAESDMLPALPDVRAIVEAEVNEAASTPLPESVRLEIAENPLFQRQKFLTQLTAQGGAAGFNRDRLVQQELQKIAQSRSREISRLLAYDLDGDGMLDAEEQASHIDSLSIRRREMEILRFTSIDSNDDTVISFDEMSFAAAIKALDHRDSRVRQIESRAQLFAFDLDGDGTVTISEVIAGVDNVASQSSEPERSEAPAHMAGCRFPEVDANAEIIALSAYGSDTLSSVTIGSDATEVQVARLTIEPGDTPLYLTATSYEAMIWMFDGQTDRVQQFIAAASSSSDQAVGVTGLTQNQITLLTGTHCLQGFDEEEELERIEARGKLASALGRIPDQMLVPESLEKLALPSGQVTEVPTNPNWNKASKPDNVDPATWGNFWRFNSGGIVEIEAADVIATGPVSPYKILPQQAGILQLVQEGKLRRLSQDFRSPYLLLKPFDQFPTGLAGAHSVDFIIPRNIPVPSGSRGHSGAFIQATGECSSHGIMCREIAAGIYDEFLN